MDSMLRGFWYLALSGRGLRPGKTVPVTLLNEQILLGRRSDGSVFAVGDYCPHRGMPMRHAGFDGDCLRCCYHGWVFRSTDGVCTEIPSNAPDEPTDPSRFSLKTWPCREVQGNVWVYVGGGEPNADPGDIPTVPGFENAVPQVSTTMRFPCNVDLAAMGFFDPGHPAFVHTSKWWKSNPASKLRLKEKHFEPHGMGFRMLRHHLKHGANPYRLLGRNVHIDIGIQLPGIRIEHIEGDRHSACVLAAATPISETVTDVHYCVYWTPKWLAPLRPFAAWMARDFLDQDRMVAVKMVQNLAPPPPLFVGGADTQVRWYLRLKREYLQAQAEGRGFVNPLRAQVLRWRS
jgi:phenylpropionate dioxygenase-like ring-hydroxylating dioxygenase large terminal subunit